MCQRPNRRGRMPCRPIHGSARHHMGVLGVCSAFEVNSPFRGATCDVTGCSTTNTQRNNRQHCSCIEILHTPNKSHTMALVPYYYGLEQVTATRYSNTQAPSNRRNTATPIHPSAPKNNSAVANIRPSDLLTTETVDCKSKENGASAERFDSSSSNQNKTTNK